MWNSSSEYISLTSEVYSSAANSSSVLTDSLVNSFIESEEVAVFCCPNLANLLLKPGFFSELASDAVDATLSLADVAVVGVCNFAGLSSCRVLFPALLLLATCLGSEFC